MNSPEYFFLKTIQTILSRFSYRRISDAGAWAGNLFDAAGIRRKVALDNLAGLVSDPEEVLRLSYQNLGRTFFELLCLDRIHLDAGSYYHLDLPADFFEAIAGGAIFISAHTGNWELMGKILIEKKVPLAVVVRKQKNIHVDRLINAQRERAGMKVIYDDDPVALRRCLDEKYCIALLADQDFGQNSIPVTFFGRPCLAAAGPEFFTKKFNRPAFLCLAMRKDKYFHRFSIVRFESEASFTQDYTTAIESAVRRDPGQWFWHHRRWKVHA
jgi:KDO2-lipid IV(A) lauroyltransferase